MWGVMLSKLISILFHRVEYCSQGQVPGGFATCEEYWQNARDDMRTESFAVAGYWALLILDCIVGNLLLYWGFGMASERLNKRVRDQSFTALIRQEVAFFDQHNVGSITSQLQDDAACIHAFSSDPVRVSAVAVSSVVTGLVISFVVRGHVR
jgi:ATP-binding cassette subfamily B (MDR/TAP) protein 1